MQWCLTAKESKGQNESISKRYCRVFDLVLCGEGPRITYSLVTALDVGDRDVDPLEKAKDLRKTPQIREIEEYGIHTRYDIKKKKGNIFVLESLASTISSWRIGCQKSVRSTIISN